MFIAIRVLAMIKAIQKEESVCEWKRCCGYEIVGNKSWLLVARAINLRGGKRSTLVLSELKYDQAGQSSEGRKERKRKEERKERT